ncbi:MAG TPA: hypothetical protein VGP92_05035 [Acidimicrobiia bacterium]|nr:hypothetical protein [Acidimicrobiia bacterium]
MSGTFILPSRPRRSIRNVDGLPTVTAVVAVAAVLAILAIALGWRGSDLPAQIFRAELFRRDGFVLWNSQWFGGHALLGYSVIAPAFSAPIGPLALGALSGIASAFIFERILRFAFGSGAWLGSIWFALGTVINLIVGRTTYAFGVAFALGAIYALQRRKPAIAIVCALLCSLASPLAGCFLAIAGVAWAGSQRAQRTQALLLVAAALAPIATVSLLFPTAGSEPYELWALIWDLSLCAVVAAALWRHNAARWGAACFAVLAIGSFLVPTALGGNVSRLGQYVAGPLLACALLPRRRLVLAALAVPLLIWQWFPAVDGIAFAHTDPSTRASYYQPLLTYLGVQSGPVGRIEIPSTFRHWEAAYAAPYVLLARGWERQLDIAYNPIFYKQPLTVASYRTWLHENGVKYVALPDARLDDSSVGERALVESGLPYLHEVWHDAHWHVWRVAGFTGLVDGPATLTSMSPDRVTLEVTGATDLVLRVRATSHWAVNPGGCATATNDGWTRLRNLPAGTVTLTQSLAGTPCPG